MLSVEEQVRRIKKKYPEGYAYLISMNEFHLPKFDDNDEMIPSEKRRKKK
jgi:hypothetical protein